MKSLVEHLLRCNMEQILSQSLLHCHAENVHSIMLLNCPGKTIRLFVAEPSHKLDQNHPDHLSSDQSVGFHAHHCDLTLLPTRGSVWNWKVEKRTFPKSQLIPEFQYQSKITHGKIGFKQLGFRNLATTSFAKLPVGWSAFMHSTDIHTIYVPTREWAAWFAFEGKENPDHDNKFWSMAPVDTQSFDHLYKPMDEQTLRQLVKEANIQ